MKKKPKKIKKTRRLISKKKIQKKKKPVVIRRKKKPRVKKRITKNTQQDVSFSAKAIFRPRIKVIGIGGGGGSIVSEIGKSLKKINFVVADTDVRAMKKKPGIKYLYFGAETTHGLGTGMNPELAKEATEKEREKITKILEGQDIVILIASLGGGLGSGATPIFAEISRSLGNVTLGIFTLPFKFEGKKKAKISQKALSDLRESLSALFTISNEKIFKITDENTSITEAFSLVNKNLIGSLESLIDLIYNPGLINIDFADVKAILDGRGMTAFLNTAEAAGKLRADQIVEDITNNPLLDNNIKAEKILFNIAGGNSLSMLEVEKISQGISKLNPKAKIIFGISRSSKFKSRIKTTLLTTGPSYLRVKAVIKIEPKKEEKKIAPVPVVIKKEPIKVIKKKIETVKLLKTKDKKENKPIAPVKKIIPIITKPVVEKSKEKEMVRRSALEVKKVQELEESKKLNQEAEWEIPAFLRRMKFKA
ncbi:MAG: cell division protein FtsZ [Candidatus Staskawiczbacteria bacterium]